MRKIFKTQNGFTIIEVITVLVILGILAVVAVSRLTNFDAEVYTGADALKNHLRYAQTLAMNSDVEEWGIRCRDGSYWLFQGKYFNDNIIRLPDDEEYIDDDRKINLDKKKISVGNFTVLFDHYGIPYSLSDTGNYVLLTSALPITVSGGSSSTTVTITPRTGFIP